MNPRIENIMNYTEVPLELKNKIKEQKSELTSIENAMQSLNDSLPVEINIKNDFKKQIKKATFRLFIYKICFYIFISLLIFSIIFQQYLAIVGYAGAIIACYFTINSCNDYIFYLKTAINELNIISETIKDVEQQQQKTISELNKYILQAETIMIKHRNGEAI